MTPLNWNDCARARVGGYIVAVRLRASEIRCSIFRSLRCCLRSCPTFSCPSSWLSWKSPLAVVFYLKRVCYFNRRNVRMNKLLQGKNVGNFFSSEEKHSPNILRYWRTFSIMYNLGKCANKQTRLTEINAIKSVTPFVSRITHLRVLIY